MPSTLTRKQTSAPQKRAATVPWASSAQQNSPGCAACTHGMRQFHQEAQTTVSKLGSYLSLPVLFTKPPWRARSRKPRCHWERSGRCGTRCPDRTGLFRKLPCFLEQHFCATADACPERRVSLRDDQNTPDIRLPPSSAQRPKPTSSLSLKRDCFDQPDLKYFPQWHSRSFP